MHFKFQFVLLKGNLKIGFFVSRNFNTFLFPWKTDGKAFCHIERFSLWLWGIYILLRPFSLGVNYIQKPPWGPGKPRRFFHHTRSFSSVYSWFPCPFSQIFNHRCSYRNLLGSQVLILTRWNLLCEHRCLFCYRQPPVPVKVLRHRW